MTKHIDEAWHIVRKVIAKSAATGFILTPEAYYVWYTYYSGDNPELVEAIDSYFTSDRGVTAEINLDLYKRFCREDGERKELRKINRQARDIMNFLVDELLSFKPRSCNWLSTEAVETGTEARRQAIFSADVAGLR